MAVAALLQLKDQGSLPFERRPVTQKFGGNGRATPGVHHGTPRRISSKPRKGSQCDGNQQNRKYGNRPALPAFFALPENERQKHQSENCEYGTNQKNRRFQ